MSSGSTRAPAPTWSACEADHRRRESQRHVLSEFTIQGVATMTPFHRALLEDPSFLVGQFDTEYVIHSEFGSAFIV